MQNLIFATNNEHKLKELRHILAGKVMITSLDEIGCHDEIPETAADLEGNALMKARFIFNKYGQYCFADDTGLEVEALGGAPGVHSARYAGEHPTMQENREKILRELSSVDEPRHAKFRTVIALIDEYGEHLFSGEILGEITKEERGETGFGYDSLFQPDGYSQTFAELGEEIKDTMSHRARAVAKLNEYLCHMYR